jgi:hypothetical protein
LTPRKFVEVLIDFSAAPAARCSRFAIPIGAASPGVIKPISGALPMIQ